MKKIYPSLVLLALASCQPKEYTWQINKSFTLEVDDSIKRVNRSYFLLDDVLHASVPDIRNRKIHLYNLALNQLSRTIDISGLPYHFDSSHRPSCVVVNMDSVFILVSSEKLLFLLDGRDSLVSSWRFGEPNPINPYEISLANRSTIPAIFSGKRIQVMTARLDVVLRTRSARQIYFSSGPDLIADLSDTVPVVIRMQGDWPLAYRKGMDYYDYFPSRTIDNKGNSYYGFAVSNEILKVNDQGKQTWLAMDHVLTPAPEEFNRDEATYPRGIFAYQASQTLYGTLVYDSYLEQFYRVLYYGMDTTGGKVPMMNEKPWDLLVLDNNMQVVDVLTGFDHHIAHPLLPTPHGLLLMRKGFTHHRVELDCVAIKPK